MIKAIPPLAAVFAAAATLIGTGAIVPAIVVGAGTWLCSRVALTLGGLAGGLVAGVGAATLGGIFGKAAEGNDGAAAGAGVGLLAGGVAGAYIGAFAGALMGAFGGYDFTRDAVDQYMQDAPAGHEQSIDVDQLSYMDRHDSRQPDPIIVAPKMTMV